MQAFAAANTQWDRKSGRLKSQHQQHPAQQQRRQRHTRIRVARASRRSFLVPPTLASGGGAGGLEEMSSEGVNKCLQKLRIVLPHVLLFTATVLYSLIGAVVFYQLESPHETEHIARHSKNILDAQNALIELEFDENDNRSLENIDAAIDNLIRVSMDAFEEGIRASDINGTTTKERWNFHSGLFFAVTVLTSIGYGHLVPISLPGRMFCVIYAFFGIPLTLITIADIAKFFADIIRGCEKRMKRMFRKYVYNSPRQHEVVQKDDNTSDDVPDPFARSSVYAQVLVLCLLFTYMSINGYIFTFLQGWFFWDSFYFCLMTLVTVGFGDIVPEVREESSYAGWIAFIFVGLILSTLTVDMIGSAWIERIHTLSRPKFKLFKHDEKHTGQPFTPSDLILIPYIDELSLQMYQNNMGGVSLASAFKASAAAPLFSLLARTRLSYPNQNHAEA